MSRLNVELAKLTTTDSLDELAKKDELVKFLNVEPPAEWLESTPDGRAKTMPIGRVEWLLTNIFQEWYVEVLKTETMFNSLVCTVRVYYKDPVDGSYKHQDGVGAAPAKTKKGAAAADMSQITNEAVQTGLPAAKSFAIKDACDHIGSIFGRNINRKGMFDFTPQYEMEKREKERRAAIQTAKKQLQAAKTMEQLRDVFVALPADIRAELEKLKDELKDKLEVANANN